MAVYVDKEANRFGRMIMCHMLADTLDELHAMAARLGLRRSWFQPKSTPHYDLSKTKRALAIQLGAIEIEREKTVELIRAWREKIRNPQSAIRDPQLEDAATSRTGHH